MNDALQNPSSYLFLVLGLIIGFALGWLFARQRPANTDSNPLPITESIAEPTAQTGINLVVNGNTVEVETTVMEAIQAMIASGDKTQASKRLREATGLNQAAAKAVVESLEKVRH